MGKQSKIIPQIATAYILLPFLIFILGWMKLFISVPLLIILVFCYWKACQAMPEVWIPELNRENIVKILFIAGIIAIWVYYSGIGKFVFQNTDHSARNGVFNILVNYQWPVVNDVILPENAGIMQTTALIYYIGFWLPAALVGKVLGLRAGYYAQAVWALLGILLVYFLICSLFKKVKIWPLFVMIFFSGLDIVGVFLINMSPSAAENIWHLEWWSTPYQYSSMTTQLFWVFNQAIPAWICTMLAYVQKNRKNLVFILACSMLSCTLPFIGLLLLVLFWCLTGKTSPEGIQLSNKRFTLNIKQYISNFISDTCTVQNVLGGGIVGIISFLYLSSNLSGNRIMGENTRGPQFNDSLAKYVIFIILEVGIYLILLYHYQQKNSLFYFVTLCLIVIPWIRVGYSVDFCMRASIPALFLLMLWVIEAIYHSWQQKNYRIFAGLILAVVIGSITPICELRRTFTETFERINTDQIVYEEDTEDIAILNSMNFSGDIESSFFFRYLAK